VRKGRGKEESLNSMKGRKKELLVYQVDLSQQNAWQQYFLNGPQEKEKKNRRKKGNTSLPRAVYTSLNSRPI